MSVVLGVVVAIYLMVLALLFSLQRRLVFVPNTQRPVLAEAGLDPAMRQVDLLTADGLRLLAWYRPPAGNPGALLLYLHGNAGHIGHRSDRIRPYLEVGFGVLLVEYRGYGGNPGRPSEAGFYADARAALDFLAQQGVTAERTVLYGESLGTGVAVQMAVERRCAALVLEAPYTSVTAVAQKRYWMFPVRRLVLDKFDSLSKIGRVGCPVFIMHGERDQIIPIRYGRELFQAAPEPKDARWFAEGNHTNFDEFGGPAAVLDFLRRQGVTA
jgi:fermentation-respiration switch protein FrsA (DUF1100 family)